jgi:hypothetical protein
MVFFCAYDLHKNDLQKTGLDQRELFNREGFGIFPAGKGQFPVLFRNLQVILTELAVRISKFCKNFILLI